MPEALDTSADAAEVQLRAYAAMDGFERLRVTAQMRSRVLKLLQFRISSEKDLVLHMFRHRIPQQELNAILERMQR